MSSSTLSTTANVPANVNTWETVTPLAVTPSPKFQLNVVSVWPVAAVDWSALNTIVWPTCGADGENTNLGAGAVSAPTFTAVDVEAERLRSLVTVSVTL